MFWRTAKTHPTPMESKVNTLEELLATNRPPSARGVDPGRVRRAIITGGDSGIGRYTALALAEDGCDVAITYAEQEADAMLTAEGVRHYGREAYVQQLDLTDPEAAAPAVDEMVRQLGGLDVFFSNAGAMTMNAFPELTLADMEHLFRVNTFGAVLACQRAAYHLLGLDPDGEAGTSLGQLAARVRKFVTGELASPRDTPGRIIVNTSVHEHIASPVDHVYTMTKHALGGFIKTAAYALAGTNVTVVGVRPGEVATPLNDMHPEDGLDADRPHVPAHRGGHPAEIASMVRYLASDATGFITGVSYDVDGGMSVGGPMAQGMYRQAA